ncbi:MAG TPA: hypothetical protein VFN45_05360 [Myxococcaceae bacterium]|jgi:hypothetical protein|nr:hypothetical protein [Myxococcaceae bacterium]
MNPSSSTFERWITGVTAATVLAVVVALLGLGIALYGPGAQARALHSQIRPVAEGVNP